MDDLDDIIELRTIDRATLAMLAERMRGSATQEQFVYREVEMDEAWRLLDVALLDAQGEERQRLRALREAVVVAHDLVGLEGRPADAAVVLREAILAGLAG